MCGLSMTPFSVLLTFLLGVWLPFHLFYQIDLYYFVSPVLTLVMKEIKNCEDNIKLNNI
jgi:hypothetical protein